MAAMNGITEDGSMESTKRRVQAGTRRGPSWQLMVICGLWLVNMAMAQWRCEYKTRAAAASPIIAPGATLQKLAGGFMFTEGPAADADGNVFFTDQPNNRILKWSTDGKLTTFLKPCGRSNGLCFDAEGNLW